MLTTCIHHWKPLRTLLRDGSVHGVAAIVGHGLQMLGRVSGVVQTTFTILPVLVDMRQRKESGCICRNTCHPPHLIVALTRCTIQDPTNNRPIPTRVNRRVRMVAGVGNVVIVNRITTDPVVEPDTLQPVGGRRRRRRKNPVDVGESVQPTLPIPQKRDEPNTRDELLQVMRQLLSEQNKSNRSDASWNSRRGPEKGVRWRGGTPPAPPAWKGSSADLRAFARWERRIEIWKLQIRSYMTDSEAALMLFTSLTGEPEQEVEHLDLAKVNCSSGISYIVDSLREPLQQRTLFQKRKLLADYEQVGRNNLESIRQYVNRYKRIERDLETVGISSGSMYDGESRGNRLLERAKLAPDLQRLVLIAAGNSLEFDKIQEAMCLQFPDFRAPPQIYYAGSGNQPRVNQQSNHRNDRWSKSSGSQSASSSSSTSTGGSSYRSGGSKGFGRGNGHRRVFQTEHQADELDDIPENDEQHEDDDEAEYQDACEEQDDQADDDDAETC